MKCVCVCECECKGGDYTHIERDIYIYRERETLYIILYIQRDRMSAQYPRLRTLKNIQVLTGF